MDELDEIEPEALTTRNAVKFLLDGTLRLRVCRYCLKICSELSDLDEILEIGIDGGLHEVVIKDMVASFHPFQVEVNTSFPNKICPDCLDCAMKAYLFTQQCERAERAIRNCFEDINDKLDKLDPIEPVKKRGKRKLHPNRNILYVENKNVMDYAHPVINIINTKSVIADGVEINALECLKCWQILPSPEALVRHEAAHPKSMWYNCKQCGKSFVKRFHLRQHLKKTHKFDEMKEETEEFGFQCKECGSYSKSLGEHFQHIEKHKFKSMLHHMIDRKLDRLCVLCFEDGTRMTDLCENICLYGGYPGLDGEHSVKEILSSVFNNIPFIDIATKVCETCLKHSINSYIFTLKIDHVKSRLNTCVTQLIYNLNSLKEIKKTVMIEISNNIILPLINYGDYDFEDEHKFNIEVLEDEFREEIVSESSESDEENPAKNVTKTYSRALVNGYKNSTKINNVCNEFLTFLKKDKRELKKSRKVFFTCPLCSKLFISDYFFKKHLLKHIYRTSKCSKCSMQFISKFHLFEHTKMVHILNKDSYYSCSSCKRMFTCVNKLKLHYKTHSVKECHLCDKVFKNQKSYDVHIQRHMMKLRLFSNRNKQTCSFCEKSCTNENELSLHVNKVHLQMKPYNCDMCEKSFYTEYNLNSHKQLHSLFSIEKCTFCSKTFKCRRSLVVHVRKHIGIKPHQCPACRQSFYSDNLMKKHMKVLHGGRYWCRLCKAVLKTSIDLKAHISVAHSAM